LSPFIYGLNQIRLKPIAEWCFSDDLFEIGWRNGDGGWGDEARGQA